MHHWSSTLLLLAIAAAILGFTGIAAGATNVAQILFFGFLILWIVALRNGRRAQIEV